VTSNAKAEAFAVARLRAMRARVYFADGFSAMTPVPIEGLGTMAVDQYWRIYYDPLTTEEWGDMAASVVVHELGHLLRGHCGRAMNIGSSLDEEAWQWAVDGEVNDSDFGTDLKLPGHPIYPQSFQCEPGGIAEQYYEHLQAATLVAILLPKQALVEVGITLPLVAVGEYSDTTKRRLAQGIVWTSSNPSIASVSTTGHVTGATPGQATVVATVGFLSAKCEIVVLSASEAEAISSGCQSGQGASLQRSRSGDAHGSTPGAPSGQAAESGDQHQAQGAGSGGSDSQRGDEGRPGRTGAKKGDDESCPGKSCSSQDAPRSNGGCGGGSGVDGVRRPWELPPDDKDRPGLSEMEADLIRRQVARAIQSAVKMAGKVPLNWRRWADQVLEPPKVPWTQELASTLRGQLAAAGTHDYSYSRPSRRRIPRVVLPAMRARRPKVGIVIDTSGSMSEDNIADGRSEVEGICRSHQAEVMVVSVDSQVHTRQRLTSARNMDLGGGGGTDMGVGMAELDRAGVDVIVVLTDGGTPWPAAPTRARTIVCLIGDGCAPKDSVPSWARAIIRDEG